MKLRSQQPEPVLLTFVSSAFVVSSVLQLSPAQSASRIPKPCDRLRKIRAHAGPDRATAARPDRGEPAPTRDARSRSVRLADTAAPFVRPLRSLRLCVPRLFF